MATRLGGSKRKMNMNDDGAVVILLELEPPARCEWACPEFQACLPGQRSALFPGEVSNVLRACIELTACNNHFPGLAA